MSNPYVLWLGAVFDEHSLLSNPALSPAGNRVQYGLINGLSKMGMPVRMVGHLPEPVWPKGRLKISADTARLDTRFDGKLVGYWNLPSFRMRQLATRYGRAAFDTVEEFGAPIAIISYNAYSYNVAAALSTSHQFKIPWICVVADVPESGSARSRHDDALEKAEGRIFLSWSEMKESGHSHNLHLDGTADGIKLDLEQALGKSRATKSIVYTGAMNRWAGVDYLVAAFTTIQRDDLRLTICGPGQPNSESRSLIENDPRIEFLGLVSEDKLWQVSENANVFVNPRPSNVPGNESNFPSKVLEYLTYGKPVVSTMTPGLSPEYGDVLIPVIEETVSGLAAAIDDASNLSRTELVETYHRTSKFIKESKTHEAQAERLLTWMRGDLGLSW